MNWNRDGEAERVTKVRAIKSWVGELIALGDDTVVMVSELACTEPGCPPLETVVVILGPAHRVRRKVHKAMADVTRQDVITLCAGYAADADDHHHGDKSS